jgi:hypothetical protein
METLTVFRIILHLGLALFSTGIVSCIIWHFSGIFTQKRMLRIAVTIIIVLASSYALYKVFFENPDVVYQKEDVLYIKPKPKIDIK